LTQAHGEVEVLTSLLDRSLHRAGGLLGHTLHRLGTFAGHVRRRVGASLDGSDSFEGTGVGLIGGHVSLQVWLVRLDGLLSY
jgi:hypothetical protein